MACITARPTALRDGVVVLPKVETRRHLERVPEMLRPKVRQAEGRHPTPSAAIIDIQSVKTTGKGGLAAMMRARR